MIRECLANVQSGIEGDLPPASHSSLTTRRFPLMIVILRRVILLAPPVTSLPHVSFAVYGDAM
jgi:hypothetical protein